MVLNFSDIKRKSVLTLISTTKIVDIGVKIFYLAKKVQLSCFFLLKIALKPFWSLGREFFYFWLISGFVLLFFLFKIIYEFLTYLSSFLDVLGQKKIYLFIFLATSAKCQATVSIDFFKKKYWGYPSGIHFTFIYIYIYIISSFEKSYIRLKYHNLFYPFFSFSVGIVSY
jgi:hypothetical protein